MTVESFEWWIGSTAKGLSVVTGIMQGMEIYTTVILILYILGAVYCRKTGASEKKWLVLKSFVSGMCCLLFLALGLLLVYFVDRSGTYLSVVYDSAPMLLSEYGEEAMQGFRAEEIMWICSLCKVAAIVVFGSFFYSAKKAYGYVRTLRGSDVRHVHIELKG